MFLMGPFKADPFDEVQLSSYSNKTALAVSSDLQPWIWFKSTDLEHGCKSPMAEAKNQCIWARKKK